MAYVNEIRVVVRAKAQKVSPPGIKAGQEVFEDDIADIDGVELLDSKNNPIDIPPDCGFAALLSCGWRKALYFDFSVLGPNGRPRSEDLRKLFGTMYSRMMFQHLLSIPDGQWQRLIAWGWFPFIGLKGADRKGLIGWATEGRKPDGFLADIAHRFTEDLEARIDLWEKHDYFKDRIEFLSRAKERLDAGDFISAISVLYPQIEGVLRSLFTDENPNDHAKQDSMVTNLVENKHSLSALLPERFQDYLLKVYFRDFDVATGEIPLSRHTIAHGISNPKDYDFVTVAVGFMVLDQISHFLTD